jgi:hypothetical protein
MNFNKLANTLFENNDPVMANDADAVSAEGARGRAPNPEIAKLIAQGMPYWKARAMTKKGLANPASVATADSLVGNDTSTDSINSSASAQKTQVAIDDFVSGNPEATPEEIINHLKALNSGPLTLKTGYITSPEEVMNMIGVAKGSGAVDADVDFQPDNKELAKQKSYANIAAAMARRGMKTGNAEEVLGKLAKNKLKLTAKASKEDEEEDDEGEIDPHVSHYVSTMKKKRFDDTDDEPEQAERN